MYMYMYMLLAWMPHVPLMLCLVGAACLCGGWGVAGWDEAIPTLAMVVV